MRKLNFALAGGVLALVAVACQEAIAPTTGRSPRIASRDLHIQGAVNTNFYGTPCNAINGNIYPDQFTVGVNGSPSDVSGPYYIKVTSPGNDGVHPETLLGHSVTATFLGTDACQQLWALVVKESDGTQGFDPTINNGGEYQVVISHTADYLEGDTKSDNFKIRVFTPPCVPGVDPECTEPPLSTFAVVKFYDKNGNGVRDAGDPFIDNWPFTLVTGAVTTSELTPFSTLMAQGTTYSATEAHPIETNWYQSAPTTNGGVFSGTMGTSDLTLEFGNYCLAGGGGLTLGFWSNQNGQAILRVNDPAWRNLLNAVDLVKASPNKTGFSVTAYDVPTGAFEIYNSKKQLTGGAFYDFQQWILAAQSSINGEARYMLSAQLAAMMLNINYGGVDGNAFDPASGMTINALVAAAIAELASPTTRDYQIQLKSWLDALNKGGSVIPVTPCAHTFASPS